MLSIRNDAIPIVINTPKETCIQRAHDTGQSDLEPVIERMFDNLRYIYYKYSDECWVDFCLSQDKWDIIVNRMRSEVTPPNYRIV